MGTNNYPTVENLLENVGKNPGHYILPFKTYCDKELELKEVNVVYTGDKNARMLVIIIEDKEGNLQDYYYNNSEKKFKPLTVNEGDDPYYYFTFRESWFEAEVGVKVPDEFKDYIPKTYKWED